MFVTVEVSGTGACEGDVLTVFDGQAVDSCADFVPNEDTFSCSEICMPLTDFEWVSNSNHVELTFTSDEEDQYRGFEIEYEFID